MRKILPIILVAGMLLASGAIGGIGKIGTGERKAVTETTSNIKIKDLGEYVTVLAENAYYLSEDGKPSLPYYVKTYTFPLGTKVKVECKPLHVESTKISKKIVPAPPAVPFGREAMLKEDESVYNSNEFYPESWYSYHTYGTVVDGKHVTLLSVHLYPVRYKAAENLIQTADDFDIKIKYELPSSELTADEYDLLIIYPSEWQSEAQRLADHKESHGIRTMMESVENIYSNYQGRDGAEKVKYFIKDALEEYGIKYVLLLGGKKSYFTGNWGLDGPTKSNDALWYVPVRYAALDDMEENGYLSDLYFADIYDAEGNFSDWDPNGDGIFASWSFKYGKENIDLAPDLAVGRLACRSLKEVQTVIDKIINYENNAHGQEWFKKMLLIGGDTFPGDPVFEGEVSTSWFYDAYMIDDGFKDTRLFVSDGSLTFGITEPNPIAGRFAWINVIKEFSTGYGFVAMDGHGSPTAWATHHPEGGDMWVNGLMTYNMDLLSNGDKLPIVVIGGCHNSEFNISLFDDFKNPWTYQPTYECFSWHLVKMANKGAIATFGNTGLGYGAGSSSYDGNGNGIPDEVEGAGGLIEDRFFNAYGEKGKDILGEAWQTAILDYIVLKPPMKRQVDAKTIEEWVLLGDPSLKVGGYS